ncbi:HAD hydrolase-like protein [Patescibacteria group bacterium]|nr:HAD hydrolase-like protein [Patescibacteria group bacterium]
MLHTQSKIKVALFDADGVTTDPRNFAINYERDFGLHPNKFLPTFFKEAFQDCLLGKADLKVVIQPYLKDWKWPGTVDEFLAYWFKSEGETNGEVIRVINQLRKRGIACYLATNQEKYRIEYMWESMGFKHIFNGICSSLDLGYKKPSREFFERLLTQIDPYNEIKTNEVLFWDDVQTNVDAAKELGIQAYLYKNEQDFKDSMSEIIDSQ